MLINLSDALTYEGRVVRSTAALEMTEFSSRLGAYEITDKSDVELVVTNCGDGKAVVTGRCELQFAAVCDRCLLPVPVSMILDMEHTVVSPEASIEDEDDESIMDGYQLDVEALVYHEILVNWPVKILCKEDCKGVCLKCGTNLNERECGCDTFIPDPRMAAIKDIFNANKEV